jgi:hypothetical protein
MHRRTLLLLPLLGPVGCLRAESDQPRSENIVSRNECPLECCPYDQDLAAAVERTAYKVPSGREVAFAMQPGDKFRLKSSFVFTRRAGIVHVTNTAQIATPNSQTRQKETIATLLPGSTLLVLYPQGRNCHRVIYNGITYSADLAQALASKKLELVTEPQFTWWARIQNSVGQSGWAKNPYELFAKMPCGKNA